MSRRRITDEERDQFVKAFEQSQPLALRSRRSATTTAKRRGEPDAKLDLHGLTEREAHHSLLLFLRASQLRGHRQVLVVTGKGKPRDPEAPFRMELERRSRGILKSEVPRWLVQRDFANLVDTTAAAQRRHGGEGAIYVYLRKPR